MCISMNVRALTRPLKKLGESLRSLWVNTNKFISDLFREMFELVLGGVDHVSSEIGLTP